jgi:phosphate transport system permease protein
MSTSNTSPDQVFDPQVLQNYVKSVKQNQSSLAKRRKEKPFVFWFLSSDDWFILCCFCLAVFYKGLPAFWQSSMTVPVYFDPALLMQVQNQQRG